MIYGTKLIYNYTVEIPKVNEKGETLVDDNGDFITEIKEQKIELSFNLMTYLIYKNVVGTDLMKDFITFGAKYKTSAEKENIFDIKDEDLSPEDVQRLSAIWDHDVVKFFINITAAMIATSEYPKQRAFTEIVKEIPINLIFDGEFIKEVVSLIAFNIKKKNK